MDQTIEDLEKALYLKLKEKFDPPVPIVSSKYIHGKVVGENTYSYRQLKAKYPTIDKFYEDYVEGGYLNTDYTTYYDSEGNKLFTQSHGNYS